MLSENIVLKSAEANASHAQVGGDHYSAGAGKCPHCGTVLQHWDIVHMFRLDYFIGNATKYLFRLGYKGDPIEQIKKAIHYLQKKLELLLQAQK